MRKCTVLFFLGPPKAEACGEDRPEGKECKRGRRKRRLRIWRSLWGSTRAWCRPCPTILKWQAAEIATSPVEVMESPMKSVLDTENSWWKCEQYFLEMKKFKEQQEAVPDSQTHGTDDAHENLSTSLQEASLEPIAEPEISPSLSYQLPRSRMSPRWMKFPSLRPRSSIQIGCWSWSFRGCPQHWWRTEGIWGRWEGRRWSGKGEGKRRYPRSSQSRWTAFGFRSQAWRRWGWDRGAPEQECLWWCWESYPWKVQSLWITLLGC